MKKSWHSISNVKESSSYSFPPQLLKNSDYFQVLYFPFIYKKWKKYSLFLRFSENELTKVLINLKMHLQGKELFLPQNIFMLKKENFNFTFAK